MIKMSSFLLVLVVLSCFQFSHSGNARMHYFATVISKIAANSYRTITALCVRGTPTRSRSYISAFKEITRTWQWPWAIGTVVERSLFFFVNLLVWPHHFRRSRCDRRDLADNFNEEVWWL